MDSKITQFIGEGKTPEALEEYLLLKKKGYSVQFFSKKQPNADEKNSPPSSKAADS